jgi:hypothetical protein
MTVRKLDASDIEAFKEVYMSDEGYLWPVVKAAVVNDLRCLLVTYTELKAECDAARAEVARLNARIEEMESDSLNDLVERDFKS